MTAPLPPLPKPRRRAVFATSKNTDSVRKGFEMGGYEKEPPMFDELQMEDYAKLAVREALEQVLIRFQPALEWVANDPCAGAYQEQAKQAGGVVRAMIEEYSK